jgi:hypothetical protein
MPSLYIICSEVGEIQPMIEAEPLGWPCGSSLTPEMQAFAGVESLQRPQRSLAVGLCAEKPIFCSLLKITG